MTSAFSLAPKGYVVLTGDSSIRRRPMQPLLDILGQLGVQTWSSRGDGCAPVIVKSGGMRGGGASIRGDVSSQFISSLLISSPLAEIDTTLKVADAVSRPYIEMTLRLAEHFGVRIRKKGYSEFEVASGRSTRRPTSRCPRTSARRLSLSPRSQWWAGGSRLRTWTRASPRGTRASPT